MSERYQYAHDAEGKKVFRFPVAPQVIPQRQGKSGRKVYHYVRMHVDIVRADNVLSGNQWKYPTSEYPNHTYDDRYDAEEAVTYFMRNFAPRRRPITKEEYERLAAEYSGT
jgi:hypothetical protein